MKCDDFLAALASGSRWQRWRAHWHARRCPHCAATARIDTELRQELGQVESLSPALCELWERAADEPVHIPRPALRHSWREALAIAAAVLLALTIGLVVFRSGWQVAVKPPDKHRPVAPHAAPAGRPIDARPELSALLAQVEALQTEIQATSKQAELLDARHKANRMIATYSQW